MTLFKTYIQTNLKKYMEKLIKQCFTVYYRKKLN